MADRSILIVEDDAVTAAAMAEVLEDAGYVAVQARSPAEADAILSASAPHAFSLVISDSFAWPVAGECWLDRLSRATAAPILICSGYDAERFGGYLERGVAAYLAKPFELDDLIGLVGTLIHGAAPVDPSACPRRGEVPENPGRAV